MGIFKDYLKSGRNNYVTEAGTYICKLDKIIRKEDLENDTIILVFNTNKRIDKKQFIDIGNNEIILKFNFYNKTQNAISFFIKVILSIMNALGGNTSEVEKECLNIIENINNLDDLKKEIEKLNKKYNKFVEIDIDRKEYNGKVFYAPDYTKDFIRFYNDIVNIDNITEDDLPF